MRNSTLCVKRRNSLKTRIYSVDGGQARKGEIDAHGEIGWIFTKDYLMKRKRKSLVCFFGEFMRNAERL
ncbi:hypothetical protein OUZ56_004276 [Daphnia magna]|uniref:Uncharacterized protein n=1 Tax=Daphnia magna TaxID=35525 RepID=A0ABQ9YP93_9CRUS|nr:hypothetical protein OUZ56_004276 [Daphnia magna]